MTEIAEPTSGPWTNTVRQRPWGTALAAFVLNLVLPPVGYVFVGRWKFALAFLVLLAALAIGALAWTFQSPPGIYRWLNGPLSYLAVTWACSVIFAVHAAWIAYHAPHEAAALRPGLLIHLAFAVGPLIIFGLMRAFLPLSVYQIPSVAMSPTLHKGDFLGVRGARALCGSVTPMVGDIIIHRQGRIRYVKRVVAGPGQVISMRDGLLSIDGMAVIQKVEGEALAVDGPLPMTGRIVRETLPSGRSYQTLDIVHGSQFDSFDPIKLPAGAWFALGDNRDNSLDSRANGPVAQRDVCGVVTKVLKSTNVTYLGARP